LDASRTACRAACAIQPAMRYLSSVAGNVWIHLVMDWAGAMRAASPTACAVRSRGIPRASAQARVLPMMVLL